MMEQTLVIATLIGVLGWIGARVHTKLDELSGKLESGIGSMNNTLSAIERDLRGELTDLDRRMTRVETHCDTCRVTHSQD
jgi:hypothetical protein